MWRILRSQWGGMEYMNRVFGAQAPNRSDSPCPLFLIPLLPCIFCFGNKLKHKSRNNLMVHIFAIHCFELSPNNKKTWASCLKFVFSYSLRIIWRPTFPRVYLFIYFAYSKYNLFFLVCSYDKQFWQIANGYKFWQILNSILFFQRHWSRHMW